MNHQTSWKKTFLLGGELEISRLGFGALHLTGPQGWGEPANLGQVQETLRLAIKLGVNFIDTADSYGPEVSERIIADTLYPYPKGLIIATKGGLVRPGPGKWTTEGRPEHLRKAVEGSLQRLKLQRIDLYQLHRPDPNVPLEESLGVLVELQKQGKIRFLGISNVTVQELEQARKVAKLISVQNLYNVANRHSEDVLAACEHDGMAFLPWYPLGKGRFLKENEKFSKLAADYKVTPAQLALGWLLQHSPHLIPIPGTSNPEHLRENMGAWALATRNIDWKQVETLF